MKLFFTIVYIRIISLRWKFDDHPLVEYPLKIKKEIAFEYQKFTSQNQSECSIYILSPRPFLNLNGTYRVPLTKKYILH